MGAVMNRLIRALTLIVILIMILAGVEIGFRVYLRVARKDIITVIPIRELLQKTWFVPHPQLIYVFKPNNSVVMKSFRNIRLTTNKFGFRSTLDFDVKAVQKPSHTLRIATIGGSTTMGVNDDDTIWPYLIGQFVQQQMPGYKIEILNAGMMGYTSLDNLLDLSMRVIDFKSDVYVIYLGINDLLAKAPLDVFRADYSHFRKTLYENLSCSSFLPPCFLRSKLFSALLQSRGVPDSRDLINNTSTRRFREVFSVPQEEIALVDQLLRDTVIRNIKSMIGIIHSHQPEARIIISSFFVKNDREFIKKLNQDMAGLVAGYDGYNVLFVDAANEIPRIPSMVYDSWHFTPQGDEQMARLFSQAILHSLIPSRDGK